MKYLLIACIAVIISRFCDAHEYIYDQDDSELSWLYDNQIYGDFDDYVPNSYRKSVHYPPIVSYPETYYVGGTTSQLGYDWNDDFPVYFSYESLPRIEKKPVYFAPPPPPTTQQPSFDGYHYPAPESKYLPPNKEAISFAPTRNPAFESKYLPPSKEPIPFAPIRKSVLPSGDGYHYPAPEVKYLPPNKGPIPFAPSRKPDVPKTVYLPPKTDYLPPTRKPTTTTRTTTRPTTTRTTTTLKPSTPKSMYLPPIVVPEPSVVGEYLPPPGELSHNLQPPPISGEKSISFH